MFIKICNPISHKNNNKCNFSLSPILFLATESAASIIQWMVARTEEQIAKGWFSIIIMMHRFLCVCIPTQSAVEIIVASQNIRIFLF